MANLMFKNGTHWIDLHRADSVREVELTELEKHLLEEIYRLHERLSKLEEMLYPESGTTVSSADGIIQWTP